MSLSSPGDHLQPQASGPSPFINSTWLKSSLSPWCWAEYCLVHPLCSSTGASVPPPPAWKSPDPPASGEDIRGCVLGSGDVPTAWLFG